MDMKIIDDALTEGRKMLTEHEAKRFLSQSGIPVTRELLAESLSAAKRAAQEIGFPVVLKGVSPTLTHKTELNMVELDIKNQVDLETAYQRITNNPKAKCEQCLVQEMIKGETELIVGLTRDLQFGPCVMFGLGGIFAEIFRDVSFRLVPLSKQDAIEMMNDIKGRKILEAFRGRSAVNLEMLSRILVSIGDIGAQCESIKEIDINPLIIQADGSGIAVDALISLSPEHGENRKIKRGKRENSHIL